MLVDGMDAWLTWRLQETLGVEMVEVVDEEMTQLHAEASFKEVSPPLKNQQKFLVTNE